VLDLADAGLPSKLEFLIPSGTSYFTLEVDNRRIHQPLSDESLVPFSGLAAGSAPGAPRDAGPVAAKATPSVAPLMTQHKAERKTGSHDFDEAPQTIPLWKLNLELESQKEEWTDFDLDVEKKVSDIDPDTRDGKKK
jgi:hypothetical protein